MIVSFGVFFEAVFEPHAPCDRLRKFSKNYRMLGFHLLVICDEETAVQDGPQLPLGPVHSGTNLVRKKLNAFYFEVRQVGGTLSASAAQLALYMRAKAVVLLLSQVTPTRQHRSGAA